jgi:hypothetical protein
MSTWVNAADHDYTLGLNRGSPDTVLMSSSKQKKVTLGELGQIWSGSLKACSIGFERLLWLQGV